ncbi:hypothetical protein N0V93_009536 [Gnomoniopsis smithogilvyi]|uniref:N-glycosylation protein EOS1 n=1 Tax=Gnomoniopsis smithogilvyi TaxID=1191159 RepID=A0A9W9CTR8_9PEZI|nr:hypothetical protein N0V93_009536 [Gnomoniopsis smithogilvyi]
MSARPPKARTWSTNTHNSSSNNNNNNSADEHRGRRRSEQKDLPPAYSTSHTTTATSINTLETHVSAISTTQQQHDGPVAAVPEPVVAAPTFLQPRVAAVLGVSKPWHPVLFLLRLFSIVPAIYFGFPVAIRGLLMLYRAFGLNYDESGRDGGAGEDKLLLTETILALMWCGCSGYLSFYFTDCLMSRWLINYTPSATALRLVAVSALNGYLQSWTLHLSGSSQDPFLLLPTWIIITSTLTMVYHITYRKINIRKETSTSISVFSMASYLSMVALLIQQHWDRSDWFDLPFVALGFRLLQGGGEVVVKVAEYANITVAP